MRERSKYTCNNFVYSNNNFFLIIKFRRTSISHKHQDMIYEMNDEDEEEVHSESEDDPNRLWCICRKPHNNRFMICCDICQDWFHGKCVNITKAMGKFDETFLKITIKFFFFINFFLFDAANRRRNGKKRHRVGLSKVFEKKK